MQTDEYRVVAHYLGGRLAKGYTFDFNQNRETFRLFAGPEQNEEGTLVYHEELKALFFVKTFEGNPRYNDPIFSEEDIKRLVGMKLKVIFKDGEVMYATTFGYSPARKGFFVYPIDKQCNNEKVYVVTSSTTTIEIIR
ncbi:MAG TPA: hypothetical protein ENO07_01205 [candidate division Zixibacteria bacterium]|nr:hypothetical protein [candidate division Zixibacteria bacterium]